MNKKIVIWALYDDASRSIFNALKNDEDVEVYSLGINDKEHEKNYLKIDLSLNNKNLEKQAEELAKKYGAPDIVFASPPCRAWTTANPGKQLRDINLDGTLNLKNAFEFDIYNELVAPNSRRDFFKENASRLEAESTTQATIKLLRFLKPEIFFIENPQASRIFKYINWFLNFRTINNVLHYNAYSPDFPKKPSIFASNLEFNTKTTNQKSSKKITELGNYNARSAIPKNLIIDLTEQAKEKIWMKKKLTNYTK